MLSGKKVPCPSSFPAKLIADPLQPPPFPAQAPYFPYRLKIPMWLLPDRMFEC